MSIDVLAAQQCFNGAVKLNHAVAQPHRPGCQLGDLQGILDRGAHVVDQRHRGRPLISTDLTSQQVQGLYSKRAFMDVVEPAITVQALSRVVTGIAIAAQDLDGPFIGFQAMFGWPGFRNGRQQLQPVQRRFPCLGTLGRGQPVDQRRAVQAKRHAPFDGGFLIHQQPLDIRMLNERHLWLRRVAPVERSALKARARIVRGVQIGCMGGGNRTVADPDPGFVHHVEHVFKPAMGLADQIALAFP